MRRVFIIRFRLLIIFSGCNSPFVKSTETFTERELTAFEDWVIPGTFHS